jgi:hypothetical protein
MSIAGLRNPSLSSCYSRDSNLAGSSSLFLQDELLNPLAELEVRESADIFHL